MYPFCIPITRLVLCSTWMRRSESTAAISYEHVVIFFIHVIWGSDTSLRIELKPLDHDHHQETIVPVIRKNCSVSVISTREWLPRCFPLGFRKASKSVRLRLTGIFNLKCLQL
jgi:hypothetical protein